MASNIVNINNTDNNITVTNANQKVIVTDNNTGISVNVTNPKTSIVQVNALGPQGGIGAQGPAGNIDTSSFVTTSSFNTFTSSYNTGSFSGSFTGQLIGTASWANSSSQALTASFVTASNVRGPYGYNSILSASYALSASWAPSGGSATPAGSDRQIQFNSNNTFAGDTSLTFDSERQLNAQRLKVTGRFILEGRSLITADDSPYTVGIDETVILCNTTKDPIDLNLEAASIQGKVLIIKDIGDASLNNITLGNAKIDGTESSFNITRSKGSIIITYDISTASWYIIGAY